MLDMIPAKSTMGVRNFGLAFMKMCIRDRADSICVHGDGPKALLFVQKIRKALAEKGVEIAPAGSFLR